MSATQSPARERLLAEDSFDGVTFEDLDLQGLDLRAKEFTSCQFRGCKAQETQWRGSRLDDCQFDRCDLTRMQARGILAHDLRFTSSKLMGVEWAELGQFPQLAFDTCVLDFASPAAENAAAACVSSRSSPMPTPSPESSTAPALLLVDRSCCSPDHAPHRRRAHPPAPRRRPCCPSRAHGCVLPRLTPHPRFPRAQDLAKVSRPRAPRCSPGRSALTRALKFLLQNA